MLESVPLLQLLSRDALSADYRLPSKKVKAPKRSSSLKMSSACYLYHGKVYSKIQSKVWDASKVQLIFFLALQELQALTTGRQLKLGGRIFKSRDHDAVIQMEQPIPDHEEGNQYVEDIENPQSSESLNDNDALVMEGAGSPKLPNKKVVFEDDNIKVSICKEKFYQHLATR